VYTLELQAFEQVKQRFQAADVEGKIDIYATTEDLTQEQYKQLLRMFPMQHFSKLERALQ
jgi:hypothetical protein